MGPSGGIPESGLRQEPGRPEYSPPEAARIAECAGHAQLYKAASRYKIEVLMTSRYDYLFAANR
jgi:hypothetical protein